MFPDNLSTHRIKTKYSLAAVDTLLVEGIVGVGLSIPQDPVHQVDSPAGHSRSGISHPHLGPPERGQLFRQALYDTFFPPDPISRRPPPLGPIIGLEKTRSELDQKKKCSAQVFSHIHHPAGKTRFLSNW